MDKNPSYPQSPPYNDQTNFPSGPNPQSPPYPQYPNTPAGGAAYYPPAQPTPAYPPAGYPSPSYPAPAYPPSQQQQQQSVVVVGAANPTPMIIQQQFPMESYGGYQAFACIVIWFFGNLLFGLIAWILAVHADSIKLTDRERARRFGRASLAMSIIGLIIAILGAIAIGVVIGWYRTSSWIYSSSSSSSRRFVGYCSSFPCCSYNEYYSNSYCYTY